MLLKRLTEIFYLYSLALLPWAWFPPFPWLHRNAQWSDLLFAASAGLWLLGRPRLNLAHAAIAAYLGFAALSLIGAPDKAQGALKLLGVAELCALAVITSDLASRPKIADQIQKVIVATAFVTAMVAIAGLMLFYLGASTRLIGSSGDLIPSSRYARVQAGFRHPNLLASFCIFASAIAAQQKGRLFKVTQLALSVAIIFSFSRGIFGFALAAAIRSARARLAVAFAAISLAAMLSLTFFNLQLDPTRPLEAKLAEYPSSRLQAIRSSLRTVVANPLLGSGIGTSPGRFRGQPFDAHMTPINIAATMGLPSLIAFCSLLGILWGGRSKPTNLALWGGLAGLALDALGQDIEDFRHLWVMIGLAIADSKRALQT
jgi:hypothetical protein